MNWVDAELMKILDGMHVDLAQLALRLLKLEEKLKELDAKEPKRTAHLALVKNGERE